MPVQTVKINVGRTRDFTVGAGRTITLLKLSIAVFQLSDGTFRAVHNRCPKGGELANGVLIGEHVFCRRHDCRVHIKSGKLKSPDSGQVETFPVGVEDGFVYLTLV